MFNGAFEAGHLLINYPADSVEVETDFEMLIFQIKVVKYSGER